MGGRGPVAAGLAPEAEDVEVVEDEDILGNAREEAKGKGREGANEGRRKASVVQSCKALEWHEGKWHEYSIQGVYGSVRELGSV